MTPRTAATAFRIVAVAEALSWIGLLAGMFVKYVPETTERLRDWARRLRLGGVGYYQGDGFIHVDTGPVRYWVE